MLTCYITSPLGNGSKKNFGADLGKSGGNFKTPKLIEINYHLFFFP
jgi:hypothetical protein